MPVLTPRVDLSGRPIPKARTRVSFQSREKKRRYKQAVKKAKQKYADETAGRWFLTFARKAAECDSCGVKLAARGEIVYRHKPRRIRCVRCAERLEDSKGYRPSIRWERVRLRQL
jgi:ribosomal protein S27E